LFGPISLVNTMRNVRFGFAHLNPDGTDSCWRLIYRFGTVEEDLGDGVVMYDTRHRLFVQKFAADDDEDGDEVAVHMSMTERDVYHVAQMDAGAQEKILFFPRVYAFHASTYEFIRKNYLKNEDVFLEYEVNVV
jgi:hypothetical protein